MMEGHTPLVCQQSLSTAADMATSSKLCVCAPKLATQLKQQRPVVVTRLALDLCQRSIDSAQNKLREAVASYLSAENPAAQEAALHEAEHAVQVAMRRFVLAKRFAEYTAMQHMQQQDVQMLYGEADGPNSNNCVDDDDGDEACSSFRPLQSA